MYLYDPWWFYSLTNGKIYFVCPYFFTCRGPFVTTDTSPFDIGDYARVVPLGVSRSTTALPCLLAPEENVFWIVYTLYAVTSFDAYQLYRGFNEFNTPSTQKSYWFFGKCLSGLS